MSMLSNRSEVATVEFQIDPNALRAEVRADLVGKLDGVGRALVKGFRRRSPDDTGALDASYTHEVDEANARVLAGTELLRGRFVELGTERMAPRAPMRRTLAEDGESVMRGLR